MILLIKFLLAVPFLLYASYSDLKTWEVPNKLWVAMLTILLPLTVLQYYLSPVNLTIIIMLWVMVWLGALNLLYNMGWGGADIKALVTIVICFPWSLLIMWIAPWLMLYSLTVVVIGYFLGLNKYPFIPIITLSYLCGGGFLWISSLN